MASAACRPAPGAFLKYDKMGEDSGMVGASAGRAGGSTSNAYVVTEKVHGANFCLLAATADGGDTVSLRFAKRTAVIGGADEAEDFYCCRSSGLLRRLAPRAEAALRLVAVQESCEASPIAVSIYGELFGGAYPHPDVPAVQGLDPVQVGVWYAPDLQFMAFDVAVEVAGGQRHFLDFFDARDVCEQADLLFAAPLCQGTLAECCDYDNRFQSTLPARLGLPPLPPGAGGAEQNLAEGVVVRPRQEPACFCRAGGRDAGRGLFKRKIEEFSERRFQNDSWRKGKAGGTGTAPALGAEDVVRWEIEALVTEQRVDNVLSKIGHVDITDKGACRQVLADLKDDVRESLDGQQADILRGSIVLEGELDKLCRQVITAVLLRRKRRLHHSVGHGEH